MKPIKKFLLLVASIMTLSLSSYAQGFFGMVWYDGVHGISLGFDVNPGPAGALLGSEYSAEAYAGTVGFPESSLSPVAQSLFAFDLNGPTALGKTAADGSGQFYKAQAVDAGLPYGQAAIQIRAWYNNGQYPTYEAARAAGVNAGKSPVMTIRLATPTNAGFQILNDIGMEPFTIGLIPEPSTIALAGLGLASLLLNRRIPQTPGGIISRRWR